MLPLNWTSLPPRPERPCEPLRSKSRPTRVPAVEYASLRFGVLLTGAIMHIAAIRLIISAAATCVLAGTGGGAAPWLQDPDQAANRPSDRDTSATESLAYVFSRRAAEAAGLEPTTSATLSLASRLFQIADALYPDQAEILRSHLAVAEFSEDALLRSELLRRLAALESDDERIRLARINDVLSRYGSAEELIEAYLVILKDENIRKLGDAVASRLAVGLAVLYERLGDSESYADWIGKATALDQSNKEAAALAAGFFQQRVDDAFGQAELLVNLLLADPMDLSTQTALARHLLNHGAFEGAVRMYELAVNTHTALRRLPSGDLLADLGIAEWGAGRPGDAMQTIRQFQRVLDESVQLRAWGEDPEMSPSERAAVTAVLPATLAVLHLALLEVEDPAAVGPALDRLLGSITTALEQSEDIDPLKRQAGRLTQAWLAAWFGSDPTAIQSFLEQADGEAVVNDVARARFEGWIALRSNELDRAEQILAPIAETDLPAMAALALVRVAQDRGPEARDLFTNIAQQDAASVLGLWARDHASRLGSHIAEQSAVAAKLELLVDSIPGAIDRIPSDQQFGLSLRIEPVEQRHRAFDPLRVRLVIANHTGLPIGISPEGPLRPNLILESEISAPSQPRLKQGPPIVVDIGRRLRLAPREKLEMIIDLRNYGVADFIAAAGAGGATLQLRGTLNPFMMSRNTIDGGPLGYVARSREMRIDGTRVTPDWLRSVIATLRAEPESADLFDLGLLLQTIHQSGTTAIHDVSPEMQTALASATGLILEKFDSFSPVLQAWILSAVPAQSEALKPLLERARTASSPLVQMTFLVHHLGGSSDPLLQQAEASGDPDVAAVAGLVRTMLEQQAQAQEIDKQQQEQRDINGQGQDGR